MKILVIGGGNMGLTYTKSFLEARIVKTDDLTILVKSAEKAFHLRNDKMGNISEKAEECVPSADLIILAVKPQDAGELFKQIRPYIEAQQVILSIMAGVKMQRISEELGATKLIRAMPNLPSQIGMGMTAFTSTDAVTRLELIMVQNLLNTTGKTIYLQNENMIDAATAISGSGPAYVYYFMNAMIDAAQGLGFSLSEAELLVGQTFMGSVHLENRSAYSCSEWISRVASKGGTTEAALKSFNKEEVHQHIIEGLQAAFNRAVELGKS